MHGAGGRTGVADTEAIVKGGTQGQEEKEKEATVGIRHSGQREAGEGVLYMREEGMHVVPEDSTGDLPDTTDAVGKGTTGRGTLPQEDKAVRRDRNYG